MHSSVVKPSLRSSSIILNRMKIKVSFRLLPRFNFVDAVSYNAVVWVPHDK